jgi:hypothetical protein
MNIRIDGIRDVEKLLHGEHESQNRVFVPMNAVISEVPDKEKKEGDEWTQSDGSQWEQTKYGPRKKTTSHREVGEKWKDESGIEWIQKDGYKVRLGSDWHQELQSIVRDFPNCRKDECVCTLPNRLDERMRRLKGMCFDCVVKMEHTIRLGGEWEQYELQCQYENALAWLKEAEADKDVIANELSKFEIANSFGDVEKWDVSVTKEQMLDRIESEFQEFKREFLSKIEQKLRHTGDINVESKETGESEKTDFGDYS